LFEAHEERNYCDWLKFGMVAAAITNCFLKKGVKALTANDFVSRGKEEKRKEQTPEEMMQMVKVLNAAFGGEVVK